MVPVKQLIVTIAQVLCTAAAELGSLLRAPFFMGFELFRTSEASNIANLDLLTNLDIGSGSTGCTGTWLEAGT